MKILRSLGNQRGVALISVYMASFVIVTAAGAAFTKSFFEYRQVQRETARIRSFAAAEAGLQNALAQIGVQAYTGFINTNPITVSSFQNTSGTPVGSSASYSVTLNYPNQADWVIVQSTATVDGDTRTVEGRVFLDSNFSKYLVHANATTFNSGTDAQYGEPDYTDEYGDGLPDYPELVPPNEDDRAALYFTGTWATTGSNVHVYGDAHAENAINGNSSSYVHGDTYVGNFATNLAGAVTQSGVTGSLNVRDGFQDDLDRNGDLTINALDYPDYHDLTADGAGDAHAKETLVTIDHNFYAANNNTPTYVGGSAVNRYLEFVPVNNGTATQIVEYSNASFATQVGTQTLPGSAIVYVKGDVYAKGQIGGRVSVVSSDDIFFDGNVSYAGGATHANVNQSTAFLAKDKLFFRANNLAVSGILYSENTSNSSSAFDATYNTSGQSDPGSKVKLRLYGNRVIKGGTNLSIYPDRVYGYDKNLKYFRPPGIPVVPDLRTVREMTLAAGSGGGSGS